MRRSAIFLALICALPLLVMVPASAESIRSIFGAGSGSGCFARSYTAEHLAKNRRQIVTSINIAFYPRKEYAAEYGPIQWEIGVTTRSSGTGGAEMYCKDSGGRVTCGVESDGGTISLSRKGDTLTVRTIDGLRFETETGFIDLSESDDQVFVLRKAAARACR